MDLQSVFSDIDQQSRAQLHSDEVITKLFEYSTGFTSSSIKNLGETKNNALDNIRVLSTIHEKDTHETVGHALYNDVQAMITVMGIEFRQVVDANVDLETTRRAAVSKRQLADQTINDNRYIAERILIPPDDAFYARKVEMLKLEATRQLKEEAFNEARIKTRSTRLDADSLQSDADILQAKIQQRHEDIDVSSFRAHCDERDQYKQEVLQRNHAKERVIIAEAESQRQLVFELYLSILYDTSNKIVAKVTAATTKHLTIQDYLKSTVTLPDGDSETVVINPLQSKHLPGIVKLLYEKFHKRNFIQFTQSLIDVLSWSLNDQDTRSNPMKGVNAVQAMVHDWQRRDLFKQLTPDMFFSAILLKGLAPGTSIRRELNREIVTMFEKQEQLSFSEQQQQANQMTIFRHSTEFIRRECEMYRLNAKDSSKSTTNSFNSKFKASTNSPQKSSGNLENAAAASIDVTKPQERFNGPVSKSQQVVVYDDKGKSHWYVAQRSPTDICPKCYPASGQATSPCAKPCFRVKCTKCNYYGHKDKNCLQTFSIHGSVIA